MHLAEQFAALRRMTRGRGDLLDEFLLFGAEEAVSKVMPFLFEAWQANPGLSSRIRKVHGRGRHRKLRRLEFEMSLDELVCHLVIAPAADAVDELVGDE